MNRGRSELVDGLQIPCEHVWVLIIFGGDVLFYGICQRNNRTAPKWESDYISGRVLDVAQDSNINVGY
jgi:hypothetical protein